MEQTIKQKVLSWWNSLPDNLNDGFSKYSLSYEYFGKHWHTLTIRNIQMIWNQEKGNTKNSEEELQTRILKQISELTKDDKLQLIYEIFETLPQSHKFRVEGFAVHNNKDIKD